MTDKKRDHEQEYVDKTFPVGGCVTGRWSSRSSNFEDVFDGYRSGSKFQSSDWTHRWRGYPVSVDYVSYDWTENRYLAALKAFDCPFPPDSTASHLWRQSNKGIMPKNMNPRRSRVREMVSVLEQPFK